MKGGCAEGLGEGGTTTGKTGDWVHGDPAHSCRDSARQSDLNAECP
jgi:hypothetical protein